LKTNTAETARRIQEKQLKGIAAIANKQLQMYDLEIIAPEIRRLRIT
jgi:prephenate dehydratase